MIRLLIEIQAHCEYYVGVQEAINF